MNLHSEIFFNRCFDKNKLKGLLSWSLKNYGEATTLELVEKLKDIGFSWATNAGISLSIDDLKIPKEKSSLLFSAEQVAESAVQQFLSGNLTTVERLQQLIDAWHRTSELLKQEVVQNFRRSDPLNPVYMMAFSGARGNISQVRQLVGMRGLMADPQGRIIDFPIRSNFREGLTLTEYVISCYGARKGIVDTALRTATSGYLTRRLVDVAQHVVVSSYDCETKHGIFLSGLKQASKIILPLSERLIGRILAEDLPGIASRNECVSPYSAGKITQIYDRVFVRSPLTCEARTGVCQLCYGWSLAHGDLVSIGEAVGIIAAQSIGEPGTQLTMRTFHTGGVFSGEIIDQIEAPSSGTVEFLNTYRGTLVRTSYGKIGFLTRQAGYFLIKNNNLVSKVDFPSQTILFVRQGQNVEQNQIVGEYAASSTDQDQGIQSTHLVTAPEQGEVFFEDVIIINDENNLENQAHQLGSFWILSGELEPNSLKSLATFSFLQSDLLLSNSSLSSFTVLKPTKFTSFLSETEQGEQTLPTLKVKLLNFSKNSFRYSKGIHFVSLKKDYLNNVLFSSNYSVILSHFNSLLLSVLNLSFENEKTTKSKRTLITFSLSDKWFLKENKDVPPSKNTFSYRSKPLEIFSIKPETKENFSITQKFKTLTNVQLGGYKFKNQRQKVQSISNPFVTKFYVNAIKGLNFETNKLQWTFKLCNVSFNKIEQLKRRSENLFLFDLFLLSSQNKIQKSKTNGLFLEKIHNYKTSYKLCSNYVFFAFFQKPRNFETLLFNYLANNSKFNLSLLNSVKKVAYFPIFNTSSFIDPYLNPLKTLNKQTLDNSLLMKTSFSFQLKVQEIHETSFGFFSVQNQNDLKLAVSSNSFFENLEVYETTQILLPKPISKVSFDKLNWRGIYGQFFQNNLILGKIDKKLNKSMEVLKILNSKNCEQFLLLSKQDLFGLEFCTKENENFVLGSLVRPGDEIVSNFTIPKCGQILSIKKDKYILRNAFPLLFSEKANFHVFHGEFIEKGLPLITLSYKRLTTGDIVQGIPRIEQLFEARQTTTILHDQLHELFETYRTRMDLEQAARKSFQKIQRILIDSIQRVYQTQGVTISDKHLEIIIRQMTSTVRILDGGRTRLLRGELKPIDWIEKINTGIDIQKAEYEPILLGITKASLETESFISAASFQETTRTLSRAAIEGRTDYLRGLKENVILGHRVPAGTGAPLISYLSKFSTENELFGLSVSENF